jgi:bifunctional DNase/RNase
VQTSRVLILKKQADRYLVIWIGPPKRSIAMKLGEATAAADDARPAPQCCRGAGRTGHPYSRQRHLERTFFARIVLDSDGKSVEIDAWRQRAVALAVRAQVPITPTSQCWSAPAFSSTRSLKALSAVNSERYRA